MLIPFLTIIVIVLGTVLIVREAYKAWKKSDVVEKKMKLSIDDEKEDIIDEMNVNKVLRKKQKEKLKEFKNV